MIVSNLPQVTVSITSMDLILQWQRCLSRNDAEQWELLALEYYRRGYCLNALAAFRKADACRASVAVETEMTK